MRPKVCLLAAAVAVAFALPTEASAKYYISQGLAESYTRDYLHETYPGERTAVLCDPKRGANESVRHRGRRLYHAWLCWFRVGEAGASCKGALSIKGSDEGDGNTYYYYRHGSRGEIC